MRLGLGLGFGCLSNLLDELDHADAVSLVENDGAAEAVQLSGEPERSEAFGVVVKAPPGGVAEGLPGALGRVQGVQSNAGEERVRGVTPVLFEAGPKRPNLRDSPGVHRQFKWNDIFSTARFDQPSVDPTGK